MCFWNDNYLLVGCNNNIIVIDINKNLFIGQYKKHNNKILTIKKIFVPKYGECLLSQGSYNDKIMV